MIAVLEALMGWEMNLFLVVDSSCAGSQDRLASSSTPRQKWSSSTLCPSSGTGCSPPGADGESMDGVGIREGTPRCSFSSGANPPGL